MTDAQKEWMLSGFFLTYALFQIPVGNLADRYGQRRVIGPQITIHVLGVIGPTILLMLLFIHYQAPRRLRITGMV